MKKVLLINGSPNEHGCTDVALQEVADTLEKNGVESEILWLGKKPMQDCIACFKCQETGKCVFGDAVVDVAQRLDEFSGMIVGSPVYYGGPTGRLTSFLMTNMHVVSSQYWNQIHGFTAEEARQDMEGLQTMRTLAQNMAYLLRAEEAAEKAGIARPEYEDVTLTNFIR